MCTLAGATEVGDFRASSLPTLLEMVAGGIGVTLVPAMAARTVRRTHPSLALLPFVKPPPQRTIGLAWRRSSAREEEYRLLGEVIQRHAVA